MDSNASSSSSSSPIPQKGFNYVLKSWVKQEEFSHNSNKDQDAVLYSVQMNPYLQRQKQYIFATVGRNRASIYECDNNGNIVLKQTYVDCCKSEDFYCCTWSLQANCMREVTDHLLIIAGARGIIRIINILQMKSVKSLKGHGSAVNDLRTHPSDPNLILSASKDHSIRLWNIRSETLVAIFGGVEGHRDEVLSADFHLGLDYIVSCGMDHALKIWSLNTEKIKKAIQNSNTYNHMKSNKDPFKTAKESFPIFSTRNIHRNYIDSVSWFGNFILSKSCDDAIVLWKPGKMENADDIQLPTEYTTDQTVTILHKFDFAFNDNWFMRLTLNYPLLAVGNSFGTIYIWKINEDNPIASRAITVKTGKCLKAVRQVCFSADSRIMVAISDDSSIWRFQLEEC